MTFSLLSLFRQYRHSQWKLEAHPRPSLVINCSLSTWSLQLSSEEINARLVEGKTSRLDDDDSTSV